MLKIGGIHVVRVSLDVVKGMILEGVLSDNACVRSISCLEIVLES